MISRIYGGYLGAFPERIFQSTIILSMIDAISKPQAHNIDNDEDDTEDKINKMNMDRAIKVGEFEELYNNLFKNNLSRLSK